MLPRVRRFRIAAAVLVLAGAFQAPAQEPTDPAAEVALWIERLGSSSFEEREEAERRLTDLGNAAVEALQRAAQGDDPETQWRALRVLRAIRWRIPEGIPDDLRRNLENYDRLEPAGRLAALESLLEHAGEKGVPIWETVLGTESEPALLEAAWDFLQRFAEPGILARAEAGLAARQEPAARRVRAWVLSQTGRTAEAHGLFLDLWRANPADLEFADQLLQVLQGFQDWARMCEILAPHVNWEDDSHVSTWARTLARAGRTDESLEAAKRALEARPASLQLRWLRGSLLLDASRWAEGMDLLLPMVRDTDREFLWQRIATAAREAPAGSFPDVRASNRVAVATLRASLDGVPASDRPAVLREIRLRTFLEATFAREAGEADAEITALREAVSTDGAGAGDHLRLGRRLLDMERFEETAKAMTLAREAGHDTPEVRALQAAAEGMPGADAGRLDALEPMLQQMGGEPPQTASHMGRLLLVCGWEAGAQRCFAWGLKHPSLDAASRVSLLMQQAEIASLRGDHEEEARLLEGAEAVARGCLQVDGATCRALRRGAAAAHSHLLEAAGDAEGAWKLLEPYWRAERSDEAAIRMAQIARDAGARAAGWTERLESLLDEAAAIEREQALLFPRSGRVRNNLAWIYACAGVRSAEAEALVREALSFEPDQAAYLDTLAEALHRLDRNDEAIALEQRALYLGRPDAVSNPSDFVSTSPAFFRRQIARFRAGEPKDPVE